MSVGLSSAVTGVDGGELPGGILAVRPWAVLQGSEWATRLAELRTEEAELVRRRRLFPNVI